MRLNISVPDALAEEVRKRALPTSAICQRALRDEVSRLQAIEKGATEEITVSVGLPPVEVRFDGRWLVAPDPARTFTSDKSYEASAYFGVALTSRGRIAVYMANSDNKWPRRLADYDSLDQAAGPADILAAAAAALSEKPAIRRDI